MICCPHIKAWLQRGMHRSGGLERGRWGKTNATLLSSTVDDRQYAINDQERMYEVVRQAVFGGGETSSMASGVIQI